MAKNFQKKKNFSGVTETMFSGVEEPKPVDVSRPVKVKERQSERLQLTIKPSTKAALSQYAEDHDTTMNAVILQLIESFLGDNNYT